MRFRKWMAAVLLTFCEILAAGTCEAADNYHGNQLYFGKGGFVCALNTKTGKVSRICEVVKTKYNPIGTVSYYKGKLFFAVDLAAAAGDYGRHQRYIYSVDVKGKGLRRLAPGYAPQALNDTVYYIRESYNKKTGYGKSAGLYRMKTDGSGSEEIVPDDVRQFAVVGTKLFWITSNGSNPVGKKRCGYYNPLLIMDLTDPEKKEAYDSPFYEIGYICDYDKKYIYYTEDGNDEKEIYSRGETDLDSRTWKGHKGYGSLIPEEIDLFSKKYKKVPSRFIGYQNDCYVYRMEKQWKLYYPVTGKTTVLKGIKGTSGADSLVAAGGGWLVLTHPKKTGQNDTAMSVIRIDGKKLRTIYTWKAE